jgi:apolipoprotein D and lipocalin family protein
MMTISLCLAITALAFSGAVEVHGQDKSPLQVVPDVDLARYAGLWHEIARLPNRFQKRCTGEVTAHYTLRPDGRVTVVNRCRVEGGAFTEAKGIARRAGKDKPNSMLKVRFAPAILSFLPQVWGDYHILALSKDYRYAVVGAPSREYLWILSRSPDLDENTYQTLVAEARRQGFDTDLLQRTK